MLGDMGSTEHLLSFVWLSLWVYRPYLFPTEKQVFVRQILEWLRLILYYSVFTLVWLTVPTDAEAWGRGWIGYWAGVVNLDVLALVG